MVFKDGCFPIQWNLWLRNYSVNKTTIEGTMAQHHPPTIAVECELEGLANHLRGEVKKWERTTRQRRAKAETYPNDAEKQKVARKAELTLNHFKLWFSFVQRQRGLTDEGKPLPRSVVGTPAPVQPPEELPQEPKKEKRLIPAAQTRLIGKKVSFPAQQVWSGAPQGLFLSDLDRGQIESIYRDPDSPHCPMYTVRLLTNQYAGHLLECAGYHIRVLSG